MKKLLFGLGLLMPFLLSAQQVARSVTASNGVFIGFYEYKPPTYSTGAKSPMIIFLHGIGERGDGSSTLSSVLNVGIPRNIHYGLTNMVFNYNGSQQGFVVLSPQLSYNYGNWQPFYIQEMIKYAKANLNIDTNRIYLTGLSLGGGGVWNYASSSATAAKGLAAIAPICGTCDWSGLNNIAQQTLPVWAFHAMDDGVVGVGCTQAAISGINAYNPAVAPIATYYPTGNHWIWDQVYDPSNPQLYLWFLSKSRGTSAPPPPTGGNVAPVASAGNAQTITLPTNSVSLSGSGSYDQDGTITNYTWSQVSGPGTASFVNPNVSNTSVGGLIAGTYVFKLTVTDNGGLTNSSNVSITVNAQAAPANQPPVAAVSANQTITLPTNSAFLLGSGSYDPGGGWITNYRWTQESGPNTATIAVVSNTNLDVKNMVAGTYVFKLTVTDNQGATGSATTQVTVNGGTTAAPVANAGSNQTLTLPTNSTTLNGSASSGANSYSWAQASGPTQATIAGGNTATPTVSNMAAGTYAFRLTVANAAGTTSSADVQVVVNNSVTNGNQPPVANAGSNQSLTLPTNSTYLYGSGSYDPGGGSITNYQWTQQSGPSNATITAISTTNVEVKNMIAGTYVFKLTVTDNQGATGTATVQVAVTGTTPPPPPSGGNTPPVAVAGSNQTITLPTNSVTLVGSGSYDPGGWIVDYIWEQQSGPNQATVNYLSDPNVEMKNLIAGTYVFKLIVEDNAGATSSSTVTVIVNGTSAPTGGNTAPVAVAGNTQWITLPTNSVYLMGSGSYDPGGWITNYAWSQVSGPSTATLTTISSTNVEAKNLVAGTYTFRLTVTDNGGATNSATMQVVVNGGARIASATTSPTTTTTTVASTTSTQSLVNYAVSTSGTTDKTASTNSLVLYPNPVSTTMTVQVNNSITGDLQISIMTASGIAVKTIRATKSSYDFTQQVNMQDVAQGTYVVEIRFADGTRMTSQVVKQ